MTSERPKALALLSGGLDSLLAAWLVHRQGVAVQGLVMDSGFFSLEPPGTERAADGSAHPLLERSLALTRLAGIPIALEDVSADFFAMLRRPAHGFGRQLNPCIDCKLLFLRRARERMSAFGADFIVTGEVVGQRPMSQMLHTLRHIEKVSGLEGILLRPLSARLLPPTRPEQEGWIDRDKLPGISGRGRREQLDLARQFGLTEFSQPAGGCILTDPGFARRLHDLLLTWPADQPLRFEPLVRLRLGRHFRTPGGAKIIVGRDARENAYLERYREDLALAQPLDQPGPTMLVEERGDPNAKALALRALARYTAPQATAAVRARWEHRGTAEILEAWPASEEELAPWRL